MKFIPDPTYYTIYRKTDTQIYDGIAYLLNKNISDEIYKHDVFDNIAEEVYKEIRDEINI